MNFIEKWLRWVLGFIQTDLSGLSRKDRYKLFKEVSYFSSNLFFNTPWELIEKHIEFSDNQFKEWGDTAFEIQTTLKDFFNIMTTTHGPYQLPDLSAFTRSEGIWPPSSKDHRVYFQLTFRPKGPTPKNWAIVNFAKLINGIEMHVLGKCPKCGKWFLNLSLRKKNYCSPKCASSSLALTRKQRWSEKDYDTYLKKQNKLSKKKYIEKRKAEKKPYRPRPKKRGKKLSVKVL